MDHVIGAHQVREEEDIIVLTLVGNVSLQEVKQVVSIIDGVIERHGSYGGVIDIQRLGSFSPEARGVASEWAGVRACYGNAFFGGGFTARVLMILVSRVVRITMGNLPPLDFFKSEVDARAWLTVQRERIGKPAP